MYDNEIEKFAKQLRETWANIVTIDIIAHGFKAYDQTWDELPELQRKAWIAVAKLVITRMIDLSNVSFDLGKIVHNEPDHR